MSILGSIRTATNKVNAAYKKYQAEAPAREAAQLERAKGKAAKERARASIQRERLEAKTEVTKARTALKEAQADLKSHGGGGILDGLIGRKQTHSTRTARKRPARKARTTRRKR